MSIILSLDISSVSTGWAILNNEGALLAHGVLKLKAKSHGERLGQFEKAIDTLVAQYQPTIFSFEDIWKGPSIKTYKILALYHGIAYKSAFMHFKTDAVVLMPSHLRKILAAKTELILTGKKESDKKSVFDFVKAKYILEDFEFTKHNDITDAIAVGLATALLLEEHSGSLDDVRSSLKVTKKRKNKKPKKAKKI